MTTTMIKNKRKMLLAIADVKRATLVALRDMPLADQVHFFREMSDWATCNEQIAAFHPDLNP